MSDADFYRNAFQLLGCLLLVYFLLLLVPKCRSSKHNNRSNSAEARLWKRFQETHCDVIPILDDIEKKEMVVALCNTIHNSETPRAATSTLGKLSSTIGKHKGDNFTKMVRFDLPTTVFE